MALVAYGIWRAIARPDDRRPFVLLLLAYLGFGISLCPYVVPYAATLWQPVSSPPALAFVGIGTAVIVPNVLGYSAFAHWTLRGKTSGGYGQ